jgi:hypothetical protein
MRPGQQNKRGRNRHRSSGGGGGGGGGGNNSGNPLSRIYESNGPDVKVRGTAQTVAEKYLQLGRDAQSASDIVMAESYYQYAEHYLRIVAAAQAYQQQMQPQFRRPEDGDEEGDDNQEGTSEARGRQSAEQPDIPGQPFEPDRQQQNYRPQRDYPDRDQQGNYGNRDRSRPRWQERRNEPQNANGDARPASQPRGDEQPREMAPAAPARDEGTGEPGRWEAPSFLKRPAPLPPAEAEEAGGDIPAARKPRLERKPRREEPNAENTSEAGPSEPSTVD